MKELEYQLKTYLLNFPMKMSMTSYRYTQHQSEKPIILEKDNNKYYTTGTIVYQCMHLKQHLPRHVYKFGRYLRIRCNSQPIPASTTTSENNGNTPLQDNQQTASQTQENITQPMLPQNTPTPQPHKKKTTKTCYKCYTDTTTTQYTRRNTKKTTETNSTNNANTTIARYTRKNNNRNQFNKQSQYHNRTLHQTKQTDNNSNQLSKPNKNHKKTIYRRNQPKTIIRLRIWHRLIRLRLKNDTPTNLTTKWETNTITWRTTILFILERTSSGRRLFEKKMYIISQPTL